MDELHPNACDIQDVTLDGHTYRLPFYKDCPYHGEFAMEYQATFGLYAFYWCQHCDAETKVSISPSKVLTNCT